MATESIEAPTQEGPRVYIGNLSFSTTEEQVREFLAPAGGKLVSVVLPAKAGSRRPGGFGFAEYESEAEVKAVVEKLSGSELDGRKVRLDAARTKEETEKHRAEVNEKRAAGRAARDAARAEKAAATGDTTAVTDGEAVVDGEKKKKRPSKRAPRRRLPGEEGEEGTAAEAAEGADTTAEGETVKPKPKRKARKPKEPKEARIDAEGDVTEGAEKVEKPKKERKPRLRSEPTGELSKTQIFVANLPFDLDDEGLTAIFTKLSINVKSAKVATRMRRPRNKEEKSTRASRGYGFVEVEDPAQQKEAVEKVEGTVVGDRTISAKVANEMKRVEREEVANDAKAAGEEVPAAVSA